MLDGVTEKTIYDMHKYFFNLNMTDPSKKEPGVILEVLPTNLTHDPSEDGKIFRVRLIQKNGNSFINPFALIDESSIFSWTKDEKKI